MALRRQRSVNPDFPCGADEAGESRHACAFRDLVHVQGGEEEVVVDPEPRRLQDQLSSGPRLSMRSRQAFQVSLSAAGAACDPDLAQVSTVDGRSSSKRVPHAPWPTYPPPGCNG